MDSYMGGQERIAGLVQWCVPVTTKLRKLRQESREIQFSLDYI